MSMASALPRLTSDGHLSKRKQLDNVADTGSNNSDYNRPPVTIPQLEHPTNLAEHAPV